MKGTLSNLRRDPRYYQITILGCLTLYGLFNFDLGPPPWFYALVLASALGFQFLFTKLYHLPAFDPRSPLISGLSLCLLLRTSEWWLAVVAAGIAIGSKFVFRVDKRHIFNPTNFGIVVVVLCTDAVWVSPGQWGSGIFLAFLFACVGMMVLYKAARSDVTFAFLLCWAAIVFGRAWYLSDPIAIPLRQLQSGSLLLFAFFMISDPKTTPNSRTGRIIFAALVATITAPLALNWSTLTALEIGAWSIPVDLVELKVTGIFIALIVACLFVPLLNRMFPGEAYEWSSPEPVPPKAKAQA